ncbi:molybdopterin molybdotransferase MoeA [Helicobacter burdigaliensis]|uniref:molybdopterin molybdotransferase MoeA n=1 Tax=Helicobacter burdigaliensis TaxID=2315334 RepID=UPI001E2EFE71|nr:molybdopterin molybdotransferase MoeA [Helicobacter burdigaliensis]
MAQEKIESLSLQEAIKVLEESVESKPNVEILPLLEAQNRYLATDQICQKSMPSFNSAAMDGFAFSHKAQGELKIKESIFAGDKKEILLKEDECVKIMTGAKVPEGADSLVPFEEIEGGFSNKDSIFVKEQGKIWNNIRKEGEEITKGEILLKAGEELDENALMLLATQGISHVSVYEKLKIGVFASGDELKEPWEVSSSHQIHNSNATMIVSTLKSFGMNASYGGVLKDDKEKISKVLQSPYDVIITSGGASKGEADFMREILQRSATLLIPSIKIRPGKPIMVAKMQNKFIIALPGNPLAGAVLLRFLIVPFLKNLSGARAHFLQSIPIKIYEEFTLKNRMDAMLGIINNEGFKLTQKGKYGSSQTLPLHLSNALAIFGEDFLCGEANKVIQVLPFKLIFGDKKCNFIN